MPANAFKIPSLIEIENRVINACYLIFDERTGHPDPTTDVEIMLEPGVKIHLKGRAAQLWCRRLARFIVRDEEDVIAVEPARVVRRKGKGDRATEGDE